MDAQKVIQHLSQLLSNPSAVQAYIANPNQYLSTVPGITADDAKAVFELATPIIELKAYHVDLLNRKKQMEIEIEKVNLSYRRGITETNEQTIRGFSSTMLMYQVSFYLGVVLLIVAMVFAIVTREALYPILFGSLGTIDLLTFFIAKPPLRLQESRFQQAKLNAAFYSWFIDLYNWNSFYIQYSAKGVEIDLQTMKDVSTAQIENTERLMKIISEHVVAP